jgi:hypothetical protein
LDDVSVDPVTTKTLPSQLPETKETAQGFHHEANGDFKTAAEFNGCDGRKLKMDQQTCSYSTILTEMTERKEGCLYRIKNNPKYASCLQYGTKVKRPKKCGNEIKCMSII